MKMKLCEEKVIWGQEVAGGREDSSQQGGDSSKDSQGGQADPALPACQRDHPGGAVEGGEGQAGGVHVGVDDYLK